MPVILDTEKKSPGIRVIVFCIYVMLVIGAITMVYPFMITVSASFGSAMDYSRFSPVPRSFHSREDRFVRGLARYFANEIPAVFFTRRPAYWSTWVSTGQDYEGIDRFAGEYLRAAEDPDALVRWRRIASDYADFAIDYDIADTACFYDFRDLSGYLADVYGGEFRRRFPEQAAGLSRRGLRQEALQLLDREWGIPYKDFFDVELRYEYGYPMHHPSWDYPDTPKARAYQDFKDAYRRMVFRPGAEGQWRRFLRRRGYEGPVPWPVKREDSASWPAFKEFVGRTCPASPATPFCLKTEWLKFLNRQDVKASLGIDRDATFTVSDYNRLFGARYASLTRIPFPAPADADPALVRMWQDFVRRYYPARLMELIVTPALEDEYRRFIKANFKTVEYYNRMMKEKYPAFTPIGSFADLRLKPRDHTELWRTFARTAPMASLRLHSSEIAYQEYLLGKFGSVEGVNRAYGWNLRVIQEARVPFAEAYTIAFLNNEWRYYLNDISKNYGQVFEFLFIRGRAFLNTLILIALAILATLTVNPLAAYALSRFNLRSKEKILLFLLATMAFPAAVSAIPGFLLMRDLHLLNTFAALVLPSLANGMAIFILKCFFDGLPRELYEAATIDGAREWQIFFHVTLPLTKPILAINSLSAFISAYNSWEWALLVCQKQSYWTLAVWLYQMQNLWSDYPYVIMAGFVVASIPTAIIFISCQKIILRGIVIPSMK